VRRHAKASSAGSTWRQTDGLGRIFGGALAIRTSSLGTDGSGVPSRTRVSVLAFATTALALLALAPLSQAKLVVSGFGTPGDLGGQFVSTFGPSAPRGIAVNSSGNGAPAGTTYVVDGNGNRIQRFGPKGAFDLAWGQNVSGRDERQIITWSRTSAEPNIASLGTVTLSFGAETTPPINVYTANNGEIRLENVAGTIPQLEALPSIGAGNISVTGNPQEGNTIRFIGPLGGTDVPPIVVDDSGLTALPDLTITASTIENGAGGNFAGFEICAAANLCREGSTAGTTANGGQLNNAQGVAVNQANGHVYVTESGNRRVSEFDADGDFIRAWGWDVVTSGQPNDTGTGFEICTVATECKQGASGANGGQFNFSTGYPVTDASNNVWVPDASNRRIQEFDSSGNFIAVYGYDVDALGGGGTLEKCISTAAGACQAGASGSGAGQFSFGSPKQIAFDSTGNLYAIDSGNNRVQKFDPTLLASAADFGAATFPTFTTSAVEQVTAAQGGARLDFSLTNNVSGGGERQIIELDPTDASVKDASFVGAGINDISGLAANDVAATLYATTTSKASPRAVLLLSATPPPAPAMLLNPVTVKTDTTATFSATVNPAGGFVSCKFQYSTDQITWTDVPAPACDSFATGGAQALSQSVSGLTPNTHYFLRLQVSRPLLANSTVNSLIKSFDTDSVPPVVTDVGAIQVSDTSARMVGTIDPRNASTGYVFEYGTTPALGSSTAPLVIGGGTTPITVSQVVGGLGKDTTYYFRLAATNLVGTTTSASKTFHTRTKPFPLPNPGNCENQALRQEQSTTFLPDCRAYEMVTPPDKNLGSVEENGVLAGYNVALDGSSVAFCNPYLFGEPAGQMIGTCAPYVSKRGTDRWATTQPFPRSCVLDTTGVGIIGQIYFFLSPDHSAAALVRPETTSCQLPPLASGQPSYANLYRDDFTTDPFTYTPLTTNTDTKNNYFAEPLGGSDDFSHMVYTSNRNETPDSPSGGGEFLKVYEWAQQGEVGCAEPAGCLRLASKKPNGESFETDSNYPDAFEEGDSEPNRATSTDGSHIFFQNPAGEPGSRNPGQCSATCDLYLRENGATTIHVSASECTVECGGANNADRFKWATPSGEEAFFISCAKLTDESAPDVSCGKEVGISWGTGRKGSKLYRWDENAPPGHHLVDLTVDHEPADGVQPATGGELGLLGASDDGNTAFFTTPGQIVAGAPLNTPGSKIYRWRWDGGSPTVEYLGSFNPANGNERDEVAKPTDLSQRWVTPDGKYLLLETTNRLDPIADRDTDRDVYRWDEAGGWLCASCQLPGVSSAGDSTVLETYGGTVTNSFIRGSLGGGAQRMAMSDDGRVFFQTPDPLVPGDVNGEAGCPSVHLAYPKVYACEDVYEWNDGTVSLVSDGTGAEKTVLIGTTPSGNDVFFYSRRNLVGWDTDNGVDIYDAHSGGGYPEPPPQPPGCEGAEQCHPAGTAAPNVTGAGTAVFEGPGNPAPKHHTTRPKHHKKRHHKRAQKRHQRAANNNRRAGR